MPARRALPRARRRQLNHGPEPVASPPRRRRRRSARRVRARVRRLRRDHRQPALPRRARHGRGQPRLRADHHGHDLRHRPLSGAHINPAVTIAFTLTRHFSPRDAIAYIAAQLTGATLAALVLLGVWTDKPAHLGATLPTVSAGSALLYEAILTALLMFVIMAVATDTRAVGAGAAIAIGGVIGLDALVGGPVTGASMNPARSFGPALVSGEWKDFWVYLAGRSPAPRSARSPTSSCAADRKRLHPERSRSNAMARAQIASPHNPDRLVILL